MDISNAKNTYIGYFCKCFFKKEIICKEPQNWPYNLLRSALRLLHAPNVLRILMNTI